VLILGGRHLLNSVLDGINASVFAYGATGAGKTHTMLGALGCPGVMVQTVEELYRRIKDRENEQLCEVAVSYIEAWPHTSRKEYLMISSRSTTKPCAIY
jgi:kinesin family protein 18/19